jgi:hypothetical protein
MKRTVQSIPENVIVSAVIPSVRTPKVFSALTELTADGQVIPDPRGYRFDSSRCTSCFVLCSCVVKQRTIDQLTHQPHHSTIALNAWFWVLAEPSCLHAKSEEVFHGRVLPHIFTSDLP